MLKEQPLRTRIAIVFAILMMASRPARAADVVLQLPAEDQQNINAQLGPGVVGAAVPSKTIDDPSVYFPLQEKGMTYQLTTGANSGNMQTLGLAKARRPGGKSAWKFKLSSTLDGFLHFSALGDIDMPAVSDSHEGVVVVTTPANPFLPKGMKPGETRSYSQKVVVNYLDDPTDQRYSGKVKSSYTYLGTYQVTVPAGTFNAILLRVKCKGKVGPAETHNTAYNLFAPGVGLVAMVLEEDVTAFWLFNIDSTIGKVLATQPQ